MGLFDSLFGGDSAKESRRAARIQADATEKGIEEERRQFDFTKGLLQPFVNAGTDLVDKFQSNATLQGFGDNLSSIFSSGALDPLVDERLRTVRGENARNGLRRSGEGLSRIADVPTELAFMLESLLSDRTAGVVGSGQNAAAGLGALGQQSSSAVAGLLQDQGDALAQGRINAADARAQGAQNILSLGAGLLGFFSDKRLKQNVSRVGEAHGMTVYVWDWIPEAPDFVKEQPAIGFMADEVLEKHPDMVDRVGGYLTVNYPELLEAA